jgi:hypothetical protein
VRQKPNLIYFIKPVGMEGPIKIGCSEMPDGRLETFMAWSPWPLEMLATVPGHFPQERFLHRCFAANRSHLEWFHVTSLLLETIAMAKAGASIQEICARASSALEGVAA